MAGSLQDAAVLNPMDVQEAGRGERSGPQAWADYSAFEQREPWHRLEDEIDRIKNHPNHGGISFGMITTRAIRRRVGRAYRILAGTAYSAWGGKPQELHIKSMANFDEFQQHVMEAERALKEQRQLELALIRSGSAFHVRGHCFPCHAWRRFPVTWADSYAVDGKLEPNWREQLSCPYCTLNNRLRASIHLLELMSGLSPSSDIYMTEQTMPLFRWIRARFPNTIGSEFLGASVPLGELNGAGIRNEDVTRLTFASAQFDGVLSFEVFEHVPDFRQAFSECARVLRPGGHMLFSTPFDPESATNLIRARVSSDGTIEHLLPPEYHGDPLNEGGILAFQSFGWEMLEQVREAGFDRVSALFYHSRDFGYLGRNQIQFLAVK